MRKKYRQAAQYWGNYRSPQTAQERRLSDRGNKNEDSHYPYVRAKRRQNNLVDAYDDIPVAAYDERRCWKSQRETQYRVGSRGAKHELMIDEKGRWWAAEYKLEDYFLQHDIPFNKERLYETSFIRRHEVVKNVCVRYEPVYRKTFNAETGYWVEDRSKVWFYRSIWEQQSYNPPRYKTTKYSSHVATRFTYWTDKNLNLDFVFAGP